MQVKIPFYNILNMFLTGLVLLGGIVLLFPQHSLLLINNEVIRNISTGPEIILITCVFAITYELGLIVNRLGSVVVEPICKHLNLIPFDDDYTKFNQKKNEYSIMETLSREYALSRTSCTIFLVLAVFSLFSTFASFGWIFLLIAVIYFLSCRKHAKKIVTLMQDVVETIGMEGDD